MDKVSLDNQKNPIHVRYIPSNTGSGTELHSILQCRKDSDNVLYIYCTDCIVVLSVETVEAFVLSVYR